MTNLRLAKLPNRIPVQMTIALAPDLHKRIKDYAKLYAKTYGDEESIEELIPAIISSFLDSDILFERESKSISKKRSDEHFSQRILPDELDDRRKKDRRLDRLIRLREVRERTGLSPATIYRRQADGTFPTCVRIGVKAVAWYESDIDDFVARPNSRQETNG